MRTSIRNSNARRLPRSHAPIQRRQHEIRRLRAFDSLLHVLLRRSFVEYNGLDFQTTATESGNERVCDPVAIVAVSHGEIEHARVRSEILQRHELVFITHERDCVLGNLSCEFHYIRTADDTIDRVDGREALVHQTEIVLGGEYLACRLLD